MAHDRIRPVSSRGPRRPGLPVALALVVVAIGGCGQLGDGTQDLPTSRAEAEGRVGDAVIGRLDQAREAFGGEIDVDQVCSLVADDRLTWSERDRLEAAVQLGDTLGLPSAVTDAGSSILDATDGATDRVGDLRAACAEAGADMSAG